jgi:hypothetical protein
LVKYLPQEVHPLCWSPASKYSQKNKNAVFIKRKAAFLIDRSYLLTAAVISISTL